MEVAGNHTCLKRTPGSYRTSRSRSETNRRYGKIRELSAGVNAANSRFCLGSQELSMTHASVAARAANRMDETPGAPQRSPCKFQNRHYQFALLEYMGR